MPYGPPLYGIFWGHIFCKYGGWGWSELFSSRVMLGARLNGRTATQRSKNGSEKVLGRVLGRVLGKGSQKGSEKGGGLLWVLQ